MTDEEKRRFLKKMGYNPRMLDPELAPAKRERVAYSVWRPKDKEDENLLLKLDKSFNEKEAENANFRPKSDRGRVQRDNLPKT